ncbi:MAG: PDZ domain-containing protein [Actinobacteria bacterium]|nr:PDZ domain-containing protein [Actinomycetota bacterium]
MAECSDMEVGVAEDGVARVIAGWGRTRPDLDVSPIAVITRVNRIARELQTSQDAVLNRYGTRGADFAVLATLIRLGKGEVSQVDLARELNLSAGTVSLRLDRLGREGLVARRAAAGDQRRTTVELTPAGRELFEACVAEHLRTSDELLAGLDPAERESLGSLLGKLLGSLEDPGPDERLATGFGLVVAAAATAMRMRREVGLQPLPGVIVRHVDPRGPAAAAGLREGDLVTAVAGRPVRTAADLREALGDRARLEVLRGVEKLEFELEGGKR